MRLLAHRGFWKNPEEKNSLAALSAAFSRGFGIETDLRDRDGSIVVSHDMANSASPSFDSVLDLYARSSADPSSILAFNVKADGLCATLQHALRRFNLRQYFFFDMSVPDTLSYLRAGLNVFTRRSEFETGSLLDAQAQGLWLDAFDLPYIPARDLSAALGEGRTIALVSPELHSKPHEHAWANWREVIRQMMPKDDQVLLCTDLPDQAEVFFNRAGSP